MEEETGINAFHRNIFSGGDFIDGKHPEAYRAQLSINTGVQSIVKVGGSVDRKGGLPLDLNYTIEFGPGLNKDPIANPTGVTQYQMSYSSLSGFGTGKDVQYEQSPLCAGIYHFEAWARYSKDFDGTKMLFHSRFFHDNAGLNDAHSIQGDAAVKLGSFPDAPDEWQKVSFTIRVRSASTSVNWYVGFPLKSTKGKLWVTGLKAYRLGGDGACIDTNHLGAVVRGTGGFQALEARINSIEAMVSSGKTWPNYVTNGGFDKGDPLQYRADMSSGPIPSLGSIVSVANNVHGITKALRVKACPSTKPASKCVFEYELNWDASVGQSMCPGTYEMSLNAWVDAKYNGRAMLFHANIWDSGKILVNTAIQGPQAVMNGAWPSQRGQWQRVSHRIKLTARQSQNFTSRPFFSKWRKIWI